MQKSLIFSGKSGSMCTPHTLSFIMANSIKIGIIQNAPLTADLTNNLRQIVQGYRECLDHGATLIVASAYALCGAGVKDMADRGSFLQQTAAALQCLSRELGTTPLLLGAYAPMSGLLSNADDDADFDEEDALPEHPMRGVLVPYLLEHDCVTELEDGEVIELDDLAVYVDIFQEEVLMNEQDVNIIVHLSPESWHANAAMEEEARCRWEAGSNYCPVVTVHPVGTAEELLYGGGSAIYKPGNTTQARLPFFATAAKVAAVSGKVTARALPATDELLAQALSRGIRDTVKNNGYTGVCIPMDSAYAALLAILCKEALGSNHVHAVTFCGQMTVAKELGIACRNYQDTVLPSVLDTTANASLQKAEKLRLQSALFTTYAEANGLMPLCPLTRHELMTGAFTLYGDSCGYLAPLGNLYRMDAHMLCEYFKEKYSNILGSLAEPDSPQTDRIIHELADRNISAGNLMQEHICPFAEDDVRKVQRRIIASALKRTQMPLVLHVDAERERISLPVHHRLND